MTWTWQIQSGTLFDKSTAAAGHGYAGHGDGLNNPAMCNVPDVGPLPQGKYTIGQPISDDNVGVFALPLTPDPSNDMFGRSAFFIHGDNPAMNHTASDGCIVLARPIRQVIADSGDADLIVTSCLLPSY
jgi:Protein of unknown function (DUF2778)